MTLALDPRSVAIAARKGLELARADPLRYARMSSLAERQLNEYIARKLEVRWRAGERGGKSTGGIKAGVRLSRGISRIDGRLMVRPGEAPDALALEPHWITLPKLRLPNYGRITIESNLQAQGSSMKILRQVIGSWPHRYSWVDAGKGWIANVRIRPGVESPDEWPDDNPESWSQITFFSQEGLNEEDARKAAGAGLDWIMGDETPMEVFWRECRGREEAGHPLLRWICDTPIYKPRWLWTQADFRGCFEAPRGGKVEIRSSVEDNRAFSFEQLAARREAMKADPLFEAKWHGDYVDTSGGCPFPRAPMEAMLRRCQPGRFDQITLRQPAEADMGPQWAWVERWFECDPTHFYLGIIDPSRGIDSPSHNPSEFELWDWTDRKLALRFGQVNGKGGYLDGDSIGILAAQIGREYSPKRPALLDFETNGGFGEAVMLALKRLRYPNIAHDDKTLTPGAEPEKVYGWNTDPGTTGEMIAALKNGLTALELGQPELAFRCYSRDVVQQWMDVVERADGRSPDVRPGVRHHREAMICAGRALHWMHTRKPPQYHERPGEHPFEIALRKEFGRDIPIRRKSAKQRAFPESFG